MNIAEIRKKYPQYADLTDKQIAEGFYQKYYSDMPFVEFAKKIGYKSAPDDPVDKTTGLQNIPLRIKLSFIDNPKNRQEYLSVQYETRRDGDGNLLYKNPKTKKWTLVDEKGFGLKDLSDWVGMLPEVALGTLGGVVGPITAGFGTAAGKAIKGEIAEQITDKPGYKTPRQYADDLVVSGTTGMVGEAGGRALLKSLSPMARKMTPKARAVSNLMKKYGSNSTPAQQTQSRMLFRLENIAESSFTGSKKITDFKLGQKEAVENIAQDIVDNLGNKMSDVEIGELIQHTLDKKRRAFSLTSNALYSKVDELTEGVKLPTSKLKSAIKNLKKQSSGVNALENASMKRILGELESLPEEISYRQMATIRSRLGNIGYSKASDIIPGQNQGMAKYLAKSITETIKNQKKGLSEEAINALNKANNFWASGKNTFNGKLVKSLVKSYPDEVAKKVFKPKSAHQIHQFRKVVGDKAFREARGHYVQRLIFEEGTDPDGNIVWKKIEGHLKRMGSETLREIFTPSEMIELNLFRRTVKTIQDKPPGLGGGMLVQLMQSTALLGLGGSLVKGSAAGAGAFAGIFFTPKGMANIFTSKAGIRWLTKGLVTRRGTKEATKLAARLLALAGKENIYTKGVAQ